MNHCEFGAPCYRKEGTRTWLSNNLLYNNVEAQNVKKIRTFVATSSASENQKYNNISASCPTNNNFSLRFAIISVAFNCNMRRFWRRGGFFFCILVITTHAADLKPVRKPRTKKSYRIVSDKGREIRFFHRSRDLLFLFDHEILFSKDIWIRLRLISVTMANYVINIPRKADVGACQWLEGKYESNQKNRK